MRADWRDPAAMKADAWHRTWFNFGGVNGPVSIRALGASELSSPSIVTRLQGNDAVVDLASASPTAPARGPSRCAGRWRVPRCASAGDAGSGRPSHRPRPGADRAPAPVGARPPELERSAAGGPRRRPFTAGVGLRELSWARAAAAGRRAARAARRLAAGGRAGPRRRAHRRRRRRHRRAAELHVGANSTRSQHPLSDALLDRLDAAGILVWQGVGPVDAPGAWTSRTPVQQRRAIRRVRLNVLQARLHPSVVAWNLANEVAGNGHYGGQPEYVDAGRAARAPPRSRTGWSRRLWGTHMPARAGFMYRHLDVVGLTNYEAGTRTARPGGTVQAGIVAPVDRAASAFPARC